VPDDHRVRAVWRFVVGLDLFALLSPIKSLERRARPSGGRSAQLAGSVALRDDRGRGECAAGGAPMRGAYRLSVAVRRSGNERQDLGGFWCWPRSGSGRASHRQFRGLGHGRRCSLDRVVQDGVRVRVPAERPRSAGIRPWKIAGKKRRKRYAVFKKKLRAIPARRAGARERNHGLRQFLVRGICKIKSIAFLHGLTHNMVCGWRLIAA
jgi:hypothetical protein